MAFNHWNPRKNSVGTGSRITPAGIVAGTIGNIGRSDANPSQGFCSKYPSCDRVFRSPISPRVATYSSRRRPGYATNWSIGVMRTSSNLITTPRVTTTRAVSIRQRITIVIAEWVPKIITVLENPGDQRGTPSASLAPILTSWTPRPVSVDEDPTTIVIGHPSPTFRTYPGPAVHVVPTPVAVTVRCPIIK